MPCSFQFEAELWNQNFHRVAGVDEAGRGPLAGPVVVAAVVFQRFAPAIPDLDDSKKLSAQKRETLYQQFLGMPGLEYSVVVIDAEIIDRINILEATRRAMRESVCQLPQGLPDHALIDGLPVPNFPCTQTALVKGDSLSFAIAAASVFAKVTRDRLMLEAEEKWPHYGFAKHKGYATALHRAKLREYGPCEIHRQTFAPVAQPELF